VRAAVALSGFKAAIANKPFIAAVNRCATQKSRATLSFSAAC
jgi:hypothetical protein